MYKEDLFEKSYRLAGLRQYARALSLLTGENIKKVRKKGRETIKYELGKEFYNNFYEELALPIFIDLYERSAKSYGEDDEATLTYKLWQVSCLTAMGGEENLIKAFDICMEVYKKRAKLLGIDHKDTICTLNWLGGFYFKGPAYDIKKAILVQERVYNKRVEIFGEDADLTLNAMAFYGQSLLKDGQCELAYKYLKECYGKRVKLSGETAEKSLALLNWVGTALSDLKRYKDALKVFTYLGDTIRNNYLITDEDRKANIWIDRLSQIVNDPYYILDEDEDYEDEYLEQEHNIIC